MTIVSALQLRKGTILERRDIIQTCLNIDPNSLEAILSHPEITKEKLIELSKVLFNAASAKTDDINAAQVINAGTLGTLLFPQKNATDAYNSAYNAVYMRFRANAKHKSAVSKEEINPFMILRDLALTQLGVPYLSRILAARSTWRDRVTYSPSDTRKGIRMPLIGQNEAFLFGIATVGFYLSDYTNILPRKRKIEGKADTREKHRQHISVLSTFNGNKTWYDNVVWPLMRSSFNMSPTEKPSEYISSLAMYELFRHALGYSKFIQDRSILSFETLPFEVLNDSVENLKHSYFAGIVSRQLKINEERKRLSAELMPEQNRGLARQIEHLARQLSFTPTYDDESGKIYFNHVNVLQLASSSHDFKIKLGRQPVTHRGYLFNTTQIQMVEKYAA